MKEWKNDKNFENPRISKTKDTRLLLHFLLLEDLRGLVGQCLRKMCNRTTRGMDQKPRRTRPRQPIIFSFSSRIWLMENMEEEDGEFYIEVRGKCALWTIGSNLLGNIGN